MSITPETTRRSLLVASGIAVGSAAGARAAGTPPAPTVLVEQTYLKAAPGKRAALAAYIKANWFAMDARGRDAGIFTSFALYEDIDDNADWDLVVAVGYPQGEGYEAPATKAAFDAIRKAHVEVLEGGLGLKDLGTIVRHHRLRPVGGG
jgi:hypothetical protein